MSNVQVFLDGLKYLLEQDNPPPPEHLQIVIANTPREELSSALVVATMCWESKTYDRLLKLLIDTNITAIRNDTTAQNPYPKRYINKNFFETFLLQLKIIPFTQLLSSIWLTNTVLSIEAAILVANAVLKRKTENRVIIGNALPQTNNTDNSNNNFDEGERLGDSELAASGGLTTSEWTFISLIIEYIFNLFAPTVGTISTMIKPQSGYHDNQENNDSNNTAFFENVIELETFIDNIESEILSDLISNDSSIAYGMIISSLKLLQVYNSWVNENHTKLAEIKLDSDLLSKIKLKSENEVDENLAFSNYIFTLYAIRKASDGLAPIIGYETQVFAGAMDMYSILISLTPMENNLVKTERFCTSWGHFSPGYLITLKEINSSQNNSDNSFKKVVNSLNTTPNIFFDIFEVSIVRMILVKIEPESINADNIETLYNIIAPRNGNTHERKNKKFSHENKKDENAFSETLSNIFSTLVYKVACIIDLYLCPEIEDFYGFDSLYQPSNLRLHNKPYASSLNRLVEFESQTILKYWEKHFIRILINNRKTSGTSIAWLDELLELENLNGSSQVNNVWDSL
ncbi:hypothetical protein BB561_003663 [Smittium simulii]|uniref:Uncharacterized protein n=1 Tax=Smittium simulii TaxID=133385 RepID=A0A2T9YK57_9FUNG|nr:hypothetical protein BB561_003663 [Smittium simulii]